MAAFVLIFEDDLSVPIQEQVGERHTQHFLALGERAILGGPTFGEDKEVNGRLLVADFASLEEARAWARAEPLVQSGRVLRWRATAMTIVQQMGAYVPMEGHGR